MGECKIHGLARMCHREITRELLVYQIFNQLGTKRHKIDNHQKVPFQKKKIDKNKIKRYKQKKHTKKRNGTKKTFQIYNCLTKKGALPKAPSTTHHFLGTLQGHQLQSSQSPTPFRSKAVMMKGISIRNRGCLYHLLEAHGGETSQGTPPHPKTPQK